MLKHLLTSAAILMTTAPLASEPSEKFETFATGGVLRNYGDGWTTIEDASHRSLNIHEVVTTRRYIEVRQKGGDFTVTAIVTIDNNLAEHGITVGLTGGREIARLVLYDRDGALIDPRTIDVSSIPQSNLWFYTLQGVENVQIADE